MGERCGAARARHGATGVDDERVDRHALAHARPRGDKPRHLMPEHEGGAGRRSSWPCQACMSEPQIPHRLHLDQHLAGPGHRDGLLGPDRSVGFGVRQARAWVCLSSGREAAVDEQGLPR